GVLLDQDVLAVDQAKPVDRLVEHPPHHVLAHAVAPIRLFLLVEVVRYRARGYFHDQDRKSTRLNSSHVEISYAVFCLKKKIWLSRALMHRGRSCVEVYCGCFSGRSSRICVSHIKNARVLGASRCFRQWEELRRRVRNR